MRASAVFIAAVGCSGPPAPVTQMPVIPVASRPDAAVDAPPEPIARGAACSASAPCGPGLACFELAGGYCASVCDGTPCDGTCMATAQGAWCMRACTSDADCRTDEGYVCDPQWKACSLPNVAAIVPRACPAAAPATTRAFGAAKLWAEWQEGMQSYAQTAPSGVIDRDGAFVAGYSLRMANRERDRVGIIGGTQFATDRPATDVRLARDPSGLVYAVWREGGGLRLATTPGRGGWSAPVDAGAPGDCAEGVTDCFTYPHVAAGKDTAYVMYGAFDGMRVRATRDRGKTFGPAITALAGASGNAIVGSDGRLHLVAITGDPAYGGYGAADREIQYTVSADGGRTFAKRIRVSKPGELLPYHFANPSIAVDTRRKWLYVAYVRGGRDATWDIMLAATKDGGKTWVRRRLGDDPACAMHMVPTLALDAKTGALHVAWYDTRGGGRFAHATCTIGAAKCTQTGAINDTPFATLTAGRFTSSWIGDHATLVIDDKRRTLHAMWAQPLAVKGYPDPLARAFHATMPLPKR